MSGKMAVGHDFSSSTKIGNLTSLNLDLYIIRSLKGCGHLTYDGDITCTGQTTTDTDTDYMTNIADSVFETETAEISPVKTCEIIPDNNPAVAESTPLKHHSWSYNTFTNDMKGVKTAILHAIAVMQKQITSINNVINSTNAIIESISKVSDKRARILHSDSQTITQFY